MIRDSVIINGAEGKPGGGEENPAASWVFLATHQTTNTDYHQAKTAFHINLLTWSTTKY
jgi:hypothetical protein